MKRKQPAGGWVLPYKARWARAVLVTRSHSITTSRDLCNSSLCSHCSQQCCITLMGFESLWLLLGGVVAVVHLSSTLDVCWLVSRGVCALFASLRGVAFVSLCIYGISFWQRHK